MPINIGTATSDLSQVYVGSTEISEIWVGSNQVWSFTPPIPDAPEVGGGLVSLGVNSEVIYLGNSMANLAVATHVPARTLNSVNIAWPSFETNRTFSAGDQLHLVAFRHSDPANNNPGVWSSDNASINSALTSSTQTTGDLGAFHGNNNGINITIPALANGSYPIKFTADDTSEAVYELQIGAGGSVTPLTVDLDGLSPVDLDVNSIYYHIDGTQNGNVFTTSEFQLGPSTPGTQSDAAIFIQGDHSPEDIEITVPVGFEADFSVIGILDVISETLITVRGVPSDTGTANQNVSIRSLLGLARFRRIDDVDDVVRTGTSLQVDLELINNGGETITELGFYRGGTAPTSEDIEDLIAAGTDVRAVTPFNTPGTQTFDIDFGTASSIRLGWYARTANGLAFQGIPTVIAA